jgi:hypothetical protein
MMKRIIHSRTSQWLPGAGRLSSAVPLLVMSCWALAANLEDAGAPPVQGVPLVYVVLFLILFFGTIIGFFVYLAHTWRKDEEKKKQGR